MTSLTINSADSEAYMPTPFCDQDFQALRILAGTIGRICLIIICTAGYLATFLFSTNISTYFGSLGQYYTVQVIVQQQAFFSPNGQLIEFSMNSSHSVKYSNEKNEIEGLKEMYGSEIIDEWLKLGNEEIFLNSGELSRCYMAKDGCCFGMSLDFISRYLKDIEAGKTPLAAVKAIAPLYTNGSTIQGELFQIFYLALDESLLRKSATKDTVSKVQIYWEKHVKEFPAKSLTKGDVFKIKTAIDISLSEAVMHQLEIRFAKIVNAKLAEQLEIDVDKLQKKITEEEAFKRKTAAETSFVETLDGYKCKNYKEIYYQQNATASKKHQLIGVKAGISCELKHVYEMEDASKDIMDEKFPEFVDCLTEGAYSVFLQKYDKPIGHCIALIKTRDEYFIFEPNTSTRCLANKDAAQELWRVAQNSGLIADQCYITFEKNELL